MIWTDFCILLRNIPNMRYLFLHLMLLVCITAVPQSKKIDKNITLLNNSEFIIDHSLKAKFDVKSPSGKSLIKIGKPATQKLIEALNDTSKTIMVHWVLCHIYFKAVSFAGPKEITKDDQTIYKYYLGQEKGEGLILSETKNNGKYYLYIEPSDLLTIKSYWQKKLIKN